MNSKYRKHIKELSFTKSIDEILEDAINISNDNMMSDSNREHNKQELIYEKEKLKKKVRRNRIKIKSLKRNVKQLKIVEKLETPSRNHIHQVVGLLCKIRMKNDKIRRLENETVAREKKVVELEKFIEQI